MCPLTFFLRVGNDEPFAIGIIVFQQKVRVACRCQWQDHDTFTALDVLVVVNPSTFDHL